VRALRGPELADVDGLDDLPEQLVEEIGHFFVAYKKREGHEAEVVGWASRDDAAKVIDEARKRYRRAQD